MCTKCPPWELAGSEAWLAMTRLQRPHSAPWRGAWQLA
jgi:hypothetical protein